MDNQKKLELTLCGMLPYGLKVKSKRHFCKDGEETVLQLNGIAYQEISNSWQMEFVYGYGLKFEYVYKTKFKPLLHSLDKLTKPILDGGLIPIVELAKIAYPNSGRKFKAENIFAVDETGLRFNYSDHGFHAFDGGNEWYVYNQLELFEKLKEWHFNIYDLPKEMYIEKSKSNGK